MNEAKLEQTGTPFQPANPIDNGKRKKKKVRNNKWNDVNPVKIPAI